MVSPPSTPKLSFLNFLGPNDSYNHRSGLHLTYNCKRLLNSVFLLFTRAKNEHLTRLLYGNKSLRRLVPLTVFAWALMAKTKNIKQMALWKSALDARVQFFCRLSQVFLRMETINGLYHTNIILVLQSQLLSSFGKKPWLGIGRQINLTIDTFKLWLTN